MPCLEQRARHMLDVLEKYFFDAKGLLLYNINRRTMRPFTKAELAETDVWTYEDTMFCTGLYLWALSEAWQVTGDAGAQQIGRRVFRDLQPLLAENDAIEPGYIGKPWGGHPAQHTTLDQTFYFCMGLYSFTKMADAQERRRAGEVIVANVEWWRRQKYFHGDSWLSPSHGGAMLAQVYLAFLHSGDAEYSSECERLVREHRLDEFPVRRSFRWEPADAATGLKIRRYALWHHALAPALWLLCLNWRQRAPHWQERFVEQWHKELKLGWTNDGLAYLAVCVDLRDETEAPLPLEGHSLEFGAAKSGYFAAHIALSAVLLAEAVPWMRETVAPMIRCVLEKVDWPQLTWISGRDADQINNGRDHLAHSLTSKGITAWLLAYWLSRRIGPLP
jgi:hypothetical protein